jgi:pyruvate ferredoxin oxidoreductase beta subunit/oxalate oxidoreductase subunit beta
MWTNYEWEHGEFTYQHIPKTYKPVKEYLKNQERFSHLNEEHIAKMQAFITAKVKSPGKPVEVPVLGPREQA